jgi:predicted dinucleotide-binding enzyme
MNIGVLGTGIVGQTLAGKLRTLGHEVVMGSRDPSTLAERTEPPRPGMPSFAGWHRQNEAVRLATFADAAAHAEIIFLATSGEGAVASVEAAGADALAGKVVIDVTNALEFVDGVVHLFVGGGRDSLAERIQRAAPGARVVKSLNTVTAQVMVEPQSIGGGDHVMWVAGDDETARAEVTTLLEEWFGWREIVDLGDLTGARALESYVLLWVRAWGALGTPMFNVAIRR